jgi:hypothetical protein
MMHTAPDLQIVSKEVNTERSPTLDTGEISELVETEVYEWGGPSASELW